MKQLFESLARQRVYLSHQLKQRQVKFKINDAFDRQIGAKFLLTSRTFQGKDFSKTRKTAVYTKPAYRFFSQGFLLKNIKAASDYSPGKLSFNSYRGICAGLTRYWYFAQLCDQDLLDKYGSMRFDNLTLEERMLIEEIDRLQQFQQRPTYINISRTFFYTHRLQFSNNLPKILDAYYQVRQIQKEKSFSVTDKDALIEPYGLFLAGKVFFRPKGESFSDEFIDILLDETLTNPGVLIEIVWYIQGKGAHVVGLTTFEGPNNTCIMKYFDSNTGERVFAGNDREKSKAILLEELKRSAYYDEDYMFYIYPFKGEEQTQFHVSKVLFAAYVLHCLLTAPNEEIQPAKESELENNSQSKPFCP